MAKYQDSEHIPLWNDSFDHLEFIKGEVSLLEAQATISREVSRGSRVTSIELKYAFWGVGIHPDTGEPCQLFFVRNKPGRGRFKVTVCTCQDEDDL